MLSIRFFTYPALISLVTLILSFGIYKNLIQSGITSGVSFVISFLLTILYDKINPEGKRKLIFSFLGIGVGIFLFIWISSYASQIFFLETNFFIRWNFLLGTITIIIAGFTGFYYGSLAPSINSISQSEFTKEPISDPIPGKILDSSVIIDGRILKIAKTNFIEGPFIIPNFVLREIQLISDSPDPIKRNRGRRGLDMLNELQQLNNIEVKINYIDYSDIRDVDSKLVRLARDTGGKLITNDFNLEKVAEVQGIQVLNLNALTEALRPIVLPGEELKIQVVKEGKDENQGIGYLDDGTMVVIEDGRNLIGQLVKVNVTSIIQTAAGKMIFTRAIGPVSEIENQDNPDNHVEKIESRIRKNKEIPTRKKR